MIFLCHTAIAQEFTFKELAELSEGNYENFEAIVSRKGFEFYKMETPTLEPRTKTSWFHFQKLANGKIESIDYIQRIENWRADQQKIEVTYSTYDLNYFIALKSQLTKNSFKISSTDKLADGYMIINNYRSDTFWGWTVSTVQSRDREKNIISYSLSINKTQKISN